MEDIDYGVSSLRISTTDEPLVPLFFPSSFRETCYQKAGGSYNMMISAVQSHNLVEYLHGRLWNERASFYTQSGCREGEKDTWTGNYQTFLVEISSIFNVCCVRDELTYSIFANFPQVPFSQAIVESLPMIITSDNYTVIEFYRTRYDRSLLLPGDNVTKNELKDYYRPFLDHPPRRVVNYLIEKRDGERNINFDDLYLRSIHKGAILLAKRIIDKTTEASNIHLCPRKYIFLEEDDDEDRYKVNFFDKFFRKHPASTPEEWECLIHNMSYGGRLFIHVLDNYDVKLSSRKHLVLGLIHNNVDPALINRVLNMEGVRIGPYAVEELEEYDEDYRYRVFKAMNDKIRKIIGTPRVMEGFENILLEEAIEIVELLESKGIKGRVLIDTLKSNAVAIRDIILSDKYRSRRELLNLLAKYRIFSHDDQPDNNKFVTYFDIADFTSKKRAHSRELALRMAKGPAANYPDSEYRHSAVSSKSNKMKKRNIHN